jgi:hypothetical protein
MKNYSRAYNRHKKQVKFLKRIKKWFIGSDRLGEKQYYIDLTLQGKNRTFLRTTSRPCNCEMCTYLKYKRVSKHKVIKDALKD